MFRPRQLLPRAGLLQRQERLGAGPRDHRAQQDYTLVINCTVLYFDVLYLPYYTVLEKLSGEPQDYNAQQDDTLTNNPSEST